MKGKDEMVSIWKTKVEGDCPTTMVVSRNGHLFAVELFPDGTELSVDELIEVLRDVRVKAEGLGRGHCVAALTRDDRDVWADNRSYLLNLDGINQESLKVVESAMFVAVLDEEEPKSYSDNCQKLMTGLPANRWADKSISVIQFANGFGGINCDHSPMDAMVSVVMNFFIHLGVLDLKGKWPSNGLKRKIVEPKLLQWKLDAKLQNSIQMSSSNVLKSNSEIVVKRDSFKQFGKTSIQKLKVNPDTFVQMGLQLAYYRLHGKPAPTYETATTRKYQDGRTETLRSSTNEALAFVKAMDDSICDLSKKRTLLLNAIATHDKLMKEAKDGHGCDRHLLGLSILASENGSLFTEDSDFKALYKDPAYTKSGGGGNFYLSTSTSGYTAMSGGATAMVLDGYGVFYNFEPHQVWVWLTNFRSSFVTSVEKFWVVLEDSMEDIYQTLASGQSKI